MEAPCDSAQNPHLTRDFWAVNSNFSLYLKSLPYANKFDYELVLEVDEILNLRELFVAFAVIKIHTLREHFWRYELNFAKIHEIVTLREGFRFVKSSSTLRTMKSATYASFFQRSNAIR